MRKIMLGTLFLVSTLFSAGGSVTFDKAFGGKEDDLAKTVIQTDDGYLIGGKTKSFTDNRDFDGYLIKIDKNGKKIWSKSYGGEDDEYINDIVKFGGGYAFVGSTETFGNERLSFYITQINPTGEIVWQKVYFKDEDDEYIGSSIATDGKDLVIAGTERHLNFMSSDISPFIFKLDNEGERGWEHYLGGKDDDYANKIIDTGDGYLVVGKTESYGHGDFDMYSVKLNKNGKWQWYNAYGGKDDDVVHDVIAVEDGYLLVGTTDSFGLNRSDVFVVKTDKTGKRLWQRSYGGSRDDEGYAITQSPDGGFVIAGRSESFSRRKGFELYLLKIDAKGKLKWERTYGGESDDAGYDIVTTKDGYLVVGDKKSQISRDSNVWILKLDLKGKL
ncbi:MAG TPA: hypothetical protein ENK71_00345 [Epsilonproteobacteria bacterium]|nr:hypothetical protein [Campylobacterota bacterium]